MKESKCRFIDEYVNFKQKQCRDDMKYNPDMRELFQNKIMDLDCISAKIHRGYITVDEGMELIARI